MTKTKKKFWLYAAIIIFILLCALFLLESENNENTGLPMAEEIQADVVETANPVQGSLSLTTSLTGTLESSNVVYVYAKAAGDITEVRVSAGQTVTEGEVLFVIDTDQVESAKNSLDAAQITLSEAQSNLSRMQILYDAGDLSEQEYEQYSNAVASAQVQYQSALLSYQQQVEYSNVTAPISGTVESCSAEKFDLVSQNSQLCVITGEGRQKISFYITERMLDQVEVGDTLTVEKNGTVYEAQITELNTMVDSESGLFEAEAQMEETDEIAIGSTVKLNVVTDKAEDAMLIPVDAVYYSDGDAYVYTYEDGTAHVTPVEIGIYDSQYAEVLSGLSWDTQVISTWSSNLYEGASVQLKEDTDAAEESEASEESGEDAESETAGESGEDAGDGETGENSKNGDKSETGAGTDALSGSSSNAAPGGMDAVSETEGQEV